MKSWIRIVLGLLIVAILTGIYIYFFVYNKQHPDFESEPAVYSLNAGTVFRSFRNNPEAASRIFNGKMIGLTGPVSAVEQTDSLVTVVFVYGQGLFGDEGIRITMLPGNREKALGLSLGAVVTVKGYCTGYNETDVILEQGSVVGNDLK